MNATRATTESKTIGLAVGVRAPGAIGTAIEANGYTSYWQQSQIETISKPGEVSA